METAEWERMIAVNLTGVFLCVREEVRVMRGQEPLSIDDG
jgi:NAD(P)-dependent dehydrogenase (short-subunit alcohol dehydrogenase family)